MRLQINEASGKSSTQIRDEALDEFGKLEEFKAMDDIIGGMLVKAAENKAETQKFTEIRQSRIKKELDEVSQRYGRVPTPSTLKSATGRKAALERVEEEPEDP